MQATKARSAFAERAFRVFEEECEVSLVAKLRTGDFAVVGERKAGRKAPQRPGIGGFVVGMRCK